MASSDTGVIHTVEEDELLVQDRLRVDTPERQVSFLQCRKAQSQPLHIIWIVSLRFYDVS